MKNLSPKKTKIEVYDWAVTPDHADIDFHLTETGNTDGATVEKTTGYSIGIGLAHLARILEAVGAIEIVGNIYERDDEQRVKTVAGYDLDRMRIRDDNLFDLVQDVLYENLEAVVFEIWNTPKERAEYVKEIEATPA